MAGDRRADISAVMPARKILWEIKRDYHSDVWTAPDCQLERFYAHDPEALGFGIYLVFWFGDGRPSAIPDPARWSAAPRVGGGDGGDVARASSGRPCGANRRHGDRRDETGLGRTSPNRGSIPTWCRHSAPTRRRTGTIDGGEPV